MAITNYTELQAAIATWLNRSDLTTVIPDMIKMAETRLNRELLILPGETTASLTLTANLDYIALPTGFIENISLTYDTDDHVPVQVSQKVLDDGASTAASKPFQYSISDKIYFITPADQTYAMTMRYRKKWDIANDATNALLSGDPDVYLYSTLAESGMYMKHPFLTQWQAKAQDCINSINTRSARVKGKSPLRSPIDVMGGNSYNINTDY